MTSFGSFRGWLFLSLISLLIVLLLDCLPLGGGRLRGDGSRGGEERVDAALERRRSTLAELGKRPADAILAGRRTGETRERRKGGVRLLETVFLHEKFDDAFHIGFRPYKLQQCKHEWDTVCTGDT